MASKQPPKWAPWAAAGAMVALLASKMLAWLLPYNGWGIASEAALVALGFALAFVAVRACRLSSGSLVLLAAAIYAALSFAWLGYQPGQGLGFGVTKRYLFSTPECEFTAKFAAPATISRLQLAPTLAGGRDVELGQSAALADVGALLSMRADCVPIGAAAQSGGAERLAESARAAARAWAAQTRMDVARDSLDPVDQGWLHRLEGTVGGSLLGDGPDGRPGRTVAAMWTYIGQRSVMTVYVFQTLGKALDAPALAFLSGVERR